MIEFIANFGGGVFVIYAIAAIFDYLEKDDV